MGDQRESGRLEATARTSRVPGSQRHKSELMRPGWPGGTWPSGDRRDGRRARARRAPGTGQGLDEGWDGPDARPRRSPDGDRNDPKRALSTSEKGAQTRPSECCGWVGRGRCEWARRSASGPAKRPRQQAIDAVGFTRNTALNWAFLLANRTRVSDRGGLVRCDAGRHDVS